MADLGIGGSRVWTVRGYTQLSEEESAPPNARVDRTVSSSANSDKVLDEYVVCKKQSFTSLEQQRGFLAWLRSLFNEKSLDIDEIKPAPGCFFDISDLFELKAGIEDLKSMKGVRLQNPKDLEMLLRVFSGFLSFLVTVEIAYKIETIDLLQFLEKGTGLKKVHFLYKDDVTTALIALLQVKYRDIKFITC